MPQGRLSMRKAREILRLRLGLGLSAREVARSCKISHSTVLEYERRARSAGLSWPLPEEIDDTQLERIVCGVAEPRSGKREMPDIGYLAAEIRKRHVTLSLLWLEYKAEHPDGYQYTQFCEYYKREKKKLDVVLRQEHRAGEKLFTDYAGDTVPVIDPATGEVAPAYIFVAVLGASNYTFAEAVEDLSLPSWIGSHIRALEFFRASPQIIIPDNTKCARHQAGPV